MQCPNCGATVQSGSRFCNNCGYALPQSAVPPPPAAYNPPPAYARPGKDPSTALLIELVGTLFGFMGLGWMYAGYTQRGITLLVGWLLVAITCAVLTAFTVGIFACIWLPGQIIAAVISGLRVKEAVERDNRQSAL